MTSTSERSEVSAPNNTAAAQKTTRNQVPLAQGSTNIAPTAGRSSYAAATGHSLSPNAFTVNNMATAMEGPAPSRTTHEEAMKPVNGNVPIISATRLPQHETSGAVNGSNSRPTNVATSNELNPSIAASNMHPNGGVLPAGPPNKAINFQFGEITSGSSPASGPSPALAAVSPANLSVAGTGLPRPISPQTSPSPVPRPVVSGGRPPSSLSNHTNPFVFGQSGPEAPEQSVGSCLFYRFLILSKNIIDW